MSVFRLLHCARCDARRYHTSTSLPVGRWSCNVCKTVRDARGKGKRTMSETTVVNCGRCGAPCRVAGPKNPDARMLRRSAKPEGNCINCAVAEWFVLTSLRETTDPKGLLLPHIQAQFAKILKVSRADGAPEEIDWQHVVDHWHLPFKTGKRKRETFPVFDPNTLGGASPRRNHVYFPYEVILFRK
jgi:hypothetical protein